MDKNKSLEHTHLLQLIRSNVKKTSKKDEEAGIDNFSEVGSQFQSYQSSISSVYR